ncbi:ovostatin-like [Discoglossus pictus]
MYLMRILLSLYLLCLINGGRSEPQYVLSVPAMLRSEHTEKLCLNLVGHEEALNLNVVLEYHEENITIFAENVPATNYFQCNNFSVPQVTETEPVFVTFSAIGESIKFQERKTVVIASMKNIYKFQMDKPLYKAGQNVQFRLISLSAQLLPVNEKYSMIYLTDPLGSRIAQWPDQVAQHGIVSLNYQLISDATPGSYGLTAERESGYPLKQRFTVEEYVLPRLTMTVNSPSTLSVLDEFLPFNVSTRYTYGQPVPGSVSGKWCRMPSYYYGRRSNCNKNKDGICFDITGKLGPDGTYQGVVDLKPFHMELSGFEMSLSLDLTMTEEGSGNQLRENRNVWITSQLAKIRLESPSSSYKRGINYTMIAILEDHNGRPLSGEEIEMEIIGEKIQKLKTDAEGKAKYEIDTSNYVAPNFTVKASYKNPDQCYYSSWKEYPDYPVAERTVQRFYSKSGSFLDVSAPTEELRCGQNHKIDVRYKLTRDGVGKEASEATFYYQVLSKTMIVHSGSRKVDYKDEKQSTFSFDLPVSSDNAPRSDLIVYSILQKEVIVDTVRMKPQKSASKTRSEFHIKYGSNTHLLDVCFSWVFLQGAGGTMVPNVDLLFSAAPEGICAFRVIDSSLLILNSYESFTAENKIGLIFKTGAIMRKSEVCSKEETYFDIYPKPRAFAKSAKPLSADMAPMASSMEYASMDADIAPGAAGPGAIETVRKNFVENWIWTTATVDSKGNGKLPLVVPDTITGWQGSGFCLSGKEGFGMSRYPANFTSFMPFFVELSLPNSIVRGEMLELRSSVPNYMEHCIKITVTLETSSDYEAKLQEGKLESCICSGEKAYNTWLITAKKIGEISFSVTAATSHIGKSCDGPSDPSQPSRKDTVIKSLIVEAEGIRKEVTTSNLICVEDTNSETTMEINPHETVVRGSEKAFVTILGDPLGLPLQNLRYLLQMPYGCAEQNLARMAPISCVLEYLNKTGQLTEEILTKAKRFLTEAYVRQLGFRMRSGPYNLFGGQQAKGNSWLTAYTYKTFEEAKKYIFIDPNVQKQSLIWLERSQKLENGCFQPTGKPFMNRGGTHDYPELHGLSRHCYDGVKLCLNKAFAERNHELSSACFYVQPDPI